MLCRTTRAVASFPLQRWCIRISQTIAPATATLCRPSVSSPVRSEAPSHSHIDRRHIHSTPVVHKGITPDSSDPAPPKTESNVARGSRHVAEPSLLSDEQYREYSEHYFNVLIAELEQLQEDGSDVEAEYSSGVLNIAVPSIGVYVLNKQPPNKQIWLSSPISGPKRYDWVVQGDHMHEKEGTRDYIRGQWIYLRDGSNLTTLLNKELGLAMDYDIYGDRVDEL